MVSGLIHEVGEDDYWTHPEDGLEVTTGCQFSRARTSAPFPVLFGSRVATSLTKGSNRTAPGAKLGARPDQCSESSARP